MSKHKDFPPQTVLSSGVRTVPWILLLPLLQTHQANPRNGNWKKQKRLIPFIESWHHPVSLSRHQTPDKQNQVGRFAKQRSSPALP
ncbi:uncharacterized protein SETTUDRAFT_169878 [Exserohilum turcica Et28A]|uniref:Uncharacterized protein n=1 Tax=Exserohilum turcicum (strain 28A) TaxID=671987 RepID=R0KQ52_EXST2|nr:uncharacterized protein SETTUDRAFT_169878 [Exserohilum turcica Et28A]EOA89987.1 hypothetical protein SETTUDRAFT_169878 [Exserohilum turcica Et28A]